MSHSKEQDITPQALGYSPFSRSNGRVYMHFPPDVKLCDLLPSEARQFGTILRVSRLSIERSSSHAVPDADRLPVLAEIDRLQSLFPSPPTPLERDARIIKSIASDIGLAVLRRFSS